jgi:regulator of cell morphogenesis and NO signaling
MASELLDQTLGYIASTLPGSTRVFHDLHLDFCCGGDTSLRQAAQALGLDALQVQERLHALDPDEHPDYDWNTAPFDKFIEHLLQRYHAVHREQLPELIRLAARVEHVHGERPNCPLGLTSLLQDMQMELESHMQKEEQILFPMIQRGSSPLIGGPISVMRFEHQQHGEALDRLAEITHDIQIPPNACNTWQALYRGLQEFRMDLMQHIHLENNLLFARAMGSEVQHG